MTKAFAQVYAGIFKRRLASALLWAVLILSGALCVNVVGISVIGDVNHWQVWFTDHRWHFFAWRVGLYGATAYGWGWMRNRIAQRDLSLDTRTRLRRTEIAGSLAILTVEGAAWLRTY